MPIKSASEMTCTEIFQEISKRQITALMLHDQLKDLYDFLGLPGFKCWHYHQFIQESKGFQKLKHYFVSTHNKLLNHAKTEQPKQLIPDDWYNYTRMDVTPQLRKQYVEMSFEVYKDWEEETKRCYEEYSKALYDMGKTADACRVECLVNDVSCELKQLYKWMIKLKASGYDAGYILDIQSYFHKRYK